MVALHAAPLVDSTVRGAVGGTETRAWSFAKGLARLDNTDVLLAVRNDRPLPSREYHKVNVQVKLDRWFRHYEALALHARRSDRFPWIRVHRWSPALLWQIPAYVVGRTLHSTSFNHRQPDDFYKSLPGDVFVTFGVQSTSATVIASAHATGRRAMLLLGSDADLDERYMEDSNWVNPYGDRASVCRFILDEADAIVAQTDAQQRTLQERFGRESTVIANPIDLHDWDATVEEPLPAELRLLDRFILWVGRAESVHKRPLRMIDIAGRCPELCFVMILNPRDPAVEAEVRQRCPSNVTIVPSVPFRMMPSLMRRATAFVSTSALEGFPNTFLQACALSVPIVSLEVGEEFLRQSGAGFCTGGRIEDAASQLQAWHASPTEASECGSAGRRYVEAHHDLSLLASHLRAHLAERRP